MDAHKPHLLVVDDDSLNRDLLQRFLSGDYELSVAEDADEALRVLASDAGATVALVLCDHFMPGKTGVDLARVARRQRAQLPFVLLTGYDQGPEVLDAKSNGTIAEILAKPYRAAELREIIARLVG